MKKLIATIILGIFAVILLLPSMALAQPQTLNDCCVIKSDFNIGGLKAKNEGPCVIGKAGGKCVITVNGVVDSTNMPPAATGFDEDVTCGDAVDVVERRAYEEWGLICIVNSTYNITNWIFYLLMIIVVIMVVIGGATYMLSAGNPESAKKGKSIIIYGIIGLVIALLARLIPSLVKVIVGMG